TSLKPLDPDNAPDKWEQKALFAFEKGEKEANVVLCKDGEHTARLMRPLRVEQSCLKCHEQQGYNIGDVRGGISVTVPVDSIWNAGTQQARNVFIVLSCIWLLGAITIVLVGKSVNNRRLEREQAIDALLVQKHSIDSSISPLVMMDLAGNLTYANPADLKAWRYDNESEVLNRSAVEFWESPQALLAYIERVQADGNGVTELVAKRKDGSNFDAEISGSMTLDNHDRPIGMVASCLDLTA